MKFLAAIIVCIPFFAKAQIGGDSGYQTLNLVSNPRTAALAGSSISIADGDLSQFFENPSTLDSVSAGDIFFNINPYFAGIFVFSGAYAFDVKKVKNMSLGLNYVNYNSFERTDPSGNSVGEFSTADYTIILGKAHQIESMTLGVNLKLLNSSIDEYGSTALLGDIGGIFRIKENWSLGMVFSNIGRQISNYNEITTSPIPLGIKIGTTFKPQFMPFRFTITSTNLAEDTIVEKKTTEGRSNKQVEKILRRVRVGTELLLSEHFQLLFGYNHKRKQELKLNETGGSSGFSYGLILNVKRIRLRFSRANFHAAGGSSFISLQTNLKDFKSIL